MRLPILPGKFLPVGRGALQDFPRNFERILQKSRSTFGKSENLPVQVDCFLTHPSECSCTEHPEPLANSETLAGE